MVNYRLCNRDFCSIATQPPSTGFIELDNLLDGGFYDGLYILGAISSLGKTSLTLQLADQVARRGYDSIVFSLEMSAHELMSKTISRLTFENCGGDTGIAKTNRAILTAGRNWKFYSQKEIELIELSFEEYKSFADNLFIHEGIGDIGATQIKEIVKKHMSIRNKKPFVVIDYLQILAPYEIRATDKQNTDKAVLELKRMARDLEIPIFIISSFNRDNYFSPVNMSSFKESGAIEYSSDVLLGLQFEGMDDISINENDKPAKKSEMINTIESWKRANPRKVELKILKNRNGVTGEKISFDYYPMFNSFVEITEIPEQFFSGYATKNRTTKKL